MNITSDMLYAEDEAYCYSADASDLRLAPGNWPCSLPTNIGNGLDFIKTSVGDGFVRYDQAGGCVSLVIFND